MRLLAINARVQREQSSRERFNRGGHQTPSTQLWWHTKFIRYFSGELNEKRKPFLASTGVGDLLGSHADLLRSLFLGSYKQYFLDRFMDKVIYRVNAFPYFFIFFHINSCSSCSVNSCPPRPKSSYKGWRAFTVNCSDKNSNLLYRLQRYSTLVYWITSIH